MNKEELYLAEDNLAAEIEEISEFVFNHAELGSEEFKSCKYLVEKLKEHGFTVTCPYLDLDTAFRAELYCGEGPKVAVLPSNFDSMYSLSEDKMLEEFINRELTKAGVDKTSKLIPSDILKRKKILNIIFSILIFEYITLIFLQAIL